jgi:hypothetical protein
MPVRKFRSVAEMNQPCWRTPGDPELDRAIARLWDTGRRINPRRFPPGVHRYHSIEELDAQVQRWQREVRPVV